MYPEEKAHNDAPVRTPPINLSCRPLGALNTPHSSLSTSRRPWMSTLDTSPFQWSDTKARPTLACASQLSFSLQPQRCSMPNGASETARDCRDMATDFDDFWHNRYAVSASVRIKTSKQSEKHNFIMDIGNDFEVILMCIFMPLNRMNLPPRYNPRSPSHEQLKNWITVWSWRRRNQCWLESLYAAIRDWRAFARVTLLHCKVGHWGWQTGDQYTIKGVPHKEIHLQYLIEHSFKRCIAQAHACHSLPGSGCWDQRVLRLARKRIYKRRYSASVSPMPTMAWNNST